MNEKFNLEHSGSKVAISKHGGQVLSWEIENDSGEIEQILYEGSSYKRSGIPILFPFANPLKNDILLVSGKKIGQHGFARNCKWELLNKSDSKASLELSSQALPQEYKEAYPFEFSLILEVELSQANTLIYNLILKNTGNINLPIAPGIHPYFTVDHKLKNTLKIAEIPEFKSNETNWEGQSNGTFFNFTNTATINFPDKNLTITENSKIPQFENLVVWSQTILENDYNFVCFEPFTRQTNDINDNPILVPPEKMWEVSFEFRVEY